MTNIHNSFSTHLALDILYDDEWLVVAKHICDAIPGSDYDYCDDDLRVAVPIDDQTVALFCPASEFTPSRHYIVECLNTGDILSSGTFVGYRTALHLYENKFNEL